MRCNKKDIRRVIREAVLGIHGAGMDEKDLASRLGYGGIQLNKSGPITDDESDMLAKKISSEKPERIFAYSRGAAALSKAMLDDDIPTDLPPVTYVAPAALRKWTDAPVPKLPGGSMTIIGDKDAAVPVKQACRIAKTAGTPLYVYPGKSHTSILYTHGEVGGDSYELDIDGCISDPDLPDWGADGNASPEQLEKQQQVTSKYRKDSKSKADSKNEAVLKTYIRATLRQII